MYILFVITDPDSGCFPVTDHTAYGSIDLCPGGCHHHGDAGTRYSGCNGILLFGNSVSCHTELFIHSRIDNGDARDHGDVDKPRPCLSYCHIRRTIACIIQFTRIHQGDTFQFTFNQTGDYTYICNIHPFMRGTVTVAM